MFGFSPDFVWHPSGFGESDLIEVFHGESVLDSFNRHILHLRINATASDVCRNRWAYRLDGTGPDENEFISEHWEFFDQTVTAEEQMELFTLGTYDRD